MQGYSTLYDQKKQKPGLGGSGLGEDQEVP